MLICTHLCPPEPCWFTQYNRLSVAYLLDLNVGTLPRRKKVPLVSNYLKVLVNWTLVQTVLPQASLLHYNLWQENKPPPGLHHKACQSSFQKWCAAPQWREEEPQMCHRTTASFFNLLISIKKNYSSPAIYYIKYLPLASVVKITQISVSNNCVYDVQCSLQHTALTGWAVKLDCFLFTFCFRFCDVDPEEVCSHVTELDVTSYSRIESFFSFTLLHTSSQLCLGSFIRDSYFDGRFYVV